MEISQFISWTSWIKVVAKYCWLLVYCIFYCFTWISPMWLSHWQNQPKHQKYQHLFKIITLGLSIVRLPVFNIKLYVILNEFLIKLSSQKITECVALQWSQNQLDHRFTKKITVELSVVSLWLIWWGGWGCTVRSFTAIGVGPLVNGFTNLILHRLCGLRELFDDTLKEQQTISER